MSTPVKAYYGETSLIAQDPDLDLIALSVGSHLHFKAVTPALKAGKNVFVEWPAGANLKETEELAALAKENGVRTLVGLEGRHNQVIKKVREVIDSGKLGKILSVHLMGKVINGYWGGHVVDSIADRTLDPTGGSSFLEIIGGHHLSALFHALGTSFKHLSATMSIQYPTATVIDDESLKPTGRELENTLADNVAVNGEFKSGALFTIALSSGRPPSLNGRNQYLLIIDGTEGSLKLESDESFPGPHVRDAQIYLNGEKMTVDGAGGLSTNIQNLWQAYAAGHDGEYPSLDDAVILRRALADIERSAQEGRRVYCL